MNQVIISDSEGLLKLLSKYESDFKGEVKLKIDRLNERENLKYERLLNGWLNACGCETGAIFCFISIIGYFIYTLVSVDVVNWILLRNGLIVFFCSALLGKLSGILLAKFRLRRTVKDLIKRLD